MVKKIVLSFVAILAVFAMATAQNKQVKGTVAGEDGTPIAGATVVVSGTYGSGTTTDNQGNFVLVAPANGSLEVSFIGYESATVAINGQTAVKVVLKEQTKAIDDVVVVAFGTTTKEAFTGSAKVISSDDLTKTQSTNVTDALVGKVAGLQSSNATGRPGSEQSIRIRGFGSLNAGNEPLWVVDGMPYDGDKNNINPNDIASITVLKDAASNALYGARGANGVIMVTTKKGKSGDAVVTFDGKWGVNQRALRTYDLVKDPGEYYELHYNSLYSYYTLGQGMSAEDAHIMANNTLTSNNAGGLGYNVMTVPAGQTLIGTNGKLNPLATNGRLAVGPDGEKYWLQGDNWLDAMYHNGFRQEYNVSVAQAGEKSNIYASFGYLDNEGIVDGSHNERYTARLRADVQAKKWLKVGGNFSYTHFNWKNGNDGEGESDGGNAFATAIQTPSIYPIYIRDEFGNPKKDQYGWDLYDTGDGRNAGSIRTTGGMSNDLQDIKLNKYISEGNAFSAQGFVDINIYDGLKVTINGGTTIDETRSTDVLNPYYGQFASAGGILSKGHSRAFAYNLQQLISYNKVFADKHALDIVVGHEMYNRRNYSLSAAKAKMFSYDNFELNSAVVDKNSASSYITEYINEGYFGRVQYDFDNRIILQGSYRRDASSKFHPDNRWGNFWSASAAWVISRENWFNASWVDLLKVKLSYGSQGNDSITSFLYTDLYTIENDGNDGITTIFYRKGNKDITWETNGNLNLGVEFALFKNRLSGSIDFFNRKTTDMLFSLPVPYSTGYASYWTNIGDVVNRGIEIELNADLIRTKTVLWDFTLNMTHLKNKLTKLPEAYKNNTTADGKNVGRISGNYFFTEGRSIYDFYLPTYAGVDPETGESQWYAYKDVLDDNNEVIGRERYVTKTYSEAQNNGREFQGSSVPKLFGGFATSLAVKGFDISANFTYQIGGLCYDSGYSTFMVSPRDSSVGFAYNKDLFKSWTPSNPTSNIPRFQYNDQYTAASSSRFLVDASYLNIQNITVGYTLPSKITKKFLVEKLRVYLACDNVWYWSYRNGLDPRQGFGGGTNPYYYAPVRTISGGVTVTF